MLIGRALLTSSLLLPPRLLPSTRLAAVRCLADGADGSVTGTVYSASADGAPTVRLFTKAGCTLCDVAKEVLVQAAEERPHTLEAVDIMDAEHAEWFAKYKFDIPVLHVEGKYWAKHRITLEASLDALAAAQEQRFEASKGEPDAARLERKPAGPLK